MLTRWEKQLPDVTMLRQVSPGSPRTALLEAGAGAQMIIVGARGRGGIPGMALGSVAAAPLHHAPCPVDLWLRGHHYRSSLAALDAASALVEFIEGAGSQFLRPATAAA